MGTNQIARVSFGRDDRGEGIRRPLPPGGVSTTSRRSLILGFGLCAIIAAAVAVGLTSSGHGHSVARADVGRTSTASPPVAVPAGATVVTVGHAAISRAIASGFLGLSLEFPAIPAYAGKDPGDVDPALLQLIRNLAPGQAPVLRIGGDSTDWTWWPAPHLARPDGVNYTLTPGWVTVAGALVRDLDARVILGIDLEADSTRVASTEARALIAGLGRAHVEALELGNEPELYGSFIWDGSGHTGRPRGYDFAGYSKDIAGMVGALPHVPIAGPATGAPKWFPDVGRFLAAHRDVAVVTLHRYPLQLCFVSPAQPNYPTIGNLLSAAASRGQANSVAPYVGISHSHGVPLRIDEMNTDSCGASPAVSKSFASALWVLDALFEMARVGVDGVNIHSYPGATYELFTFRRVDGRWRASVEPEYYGMLMFAQAVPPGSHLLGLSWHQRAGERLRIWATRAPDGRIHVVLINDGAKAQTVVVRVPETAGAGTLERLTARSLDATGGVTLGGQGFGSETSSGQLAGRATVTSMTPAAGRYSFRLPGASAAMLTLT